MDSCLDQLRELMGRNDVAYEVVAHPQAETTQEASAATGISGYAFAKPVVLLVGDRPELFVLRAADRIDLEALRNRFGPTPVRLAAEYEVHPLFPGCEDGGIPAVPLRDDMPVHLDSRLAHETSIIFEAGSSTEAVRMQMADYMRLVHPSILDFAQEPQRRRRRFTRGMMWRRRAMQAAPFAVALVSMALGSRVLRRKGGALRTFALGLVAGAATSSLTEPRSGGRRRALLRDKPRRWLRLGTRRVENRGRYMAGMWRGMRHRGGSLQHALSDWSRRGRPRPV